MRPYTALVRDIIVKGTLSENRTGVPAYSFPGAIFQHNMSEGFPLLTTKKMPFGRIASELEFFITGITVYSAARGAGSSTQPMHSWAKCSDSPKHHSDTFGRSLHTLFEFFHTSLRSG